MDPHHFFPLNYYYYFYRKRNFIRREEKVQKRIKYPYKDKVATKGRKDKPCNNTSQSLWIPARGIRLNKPCVEHKRDANKVILSQIKSTFEKESLKTLEFLSSQIHESTAKTEDCHGIFASLQEPKPLNLVSRNWCKFIGQTHDSKDTKNLVPKRSRRRAM